MSFLSYLPQSQTLSGKKKNKNYQVSCTVYKNVWKPKNIYWFVLPEQWNFSPICAILYVEDAPVYKTGQCSMWLFLLNLRLALIGADMNEYPWFRNPNLDSFFVLQGKSE